MNLRPQGKVVYNDFHIESPKAAALIERLLPKNKNSDVPVSKTQSMIFHPPRDKNRVMIKKIDIL